MQSVILAAGEGSRMRPLTVNRPKPMIPVANKPILEHIITECSKAGINDFIFIVGYKGNVIEDYFGNGSRWNVRIDYLEQKNVLGTADALRLTRDMVREKFIVMNGDLILKKEDIARLVNSTSITMTVKEVEDVSGLGVVETSDNFVKAIAEKPDNPTSKLANTGAYLLTDQIFSAIDQTEISSRGQYELTSSLNLLIEHGVKVRYNAVDFWLNLTYPWDLIGANELLLSESVSHCEGVTEDGVHIEGPCIVGSNSRLRSGTYIRGPVIIGQNCEIGPNCYIRSSTAIGDGCHIGAGVEIKNSIIMKGTKVPHQSYLGDCVIGERCNFGAGTKVANLRFDHRNIIVRGVDTGRRKFGAVVGDNVQTGINTTINPGTIIEDNVLLFPGMTAHGRIPESAIIKRNC